MLHVKNVSYFPWHLTLETTKPKVYENVIFQLSTSLSSIAIIQQHQRMEFTFHNSYIILWFLKTLFKQKVEVISAKFYGCHHEPVACNEMSISQKAMDFTPLRRCLFYSITEKTFTRLDYEWHGGCLIRSWN